MREGGWAGDGEGASDLKELLHTLMAAPHPAAFRLPRAVDDVVLRVQRAQVFPHIDVVLGFAIQVQGFGY